MKINLDDLNYYIITSDDPLFLSHLISEALTENKDWSLRGDLCVYVVPEAESVKVYYVQVLERTTK